MVTTQKPTDAIDCSLRRKGKLSHTHWTPHLQNTQLTGSMVSSNKHTQTHEFLSDKYKYCISMNEVIVYLYSYVDITIMMFSQKSF